MTTRPHRSRRRRNAIRGAWATGAALLAGALLWMTEHRHAVCAAAVALCAEPRVAAAALPPPQPDQATPGPDGTCKRGVPKDGGCWVYISERPPCPPPYKESEGKCWGVILEKRAPFPSSVEPPIRMTVEGPL